MNITIKNSALRIYRKKKVAPLARGVDQNFCLLMKTSANQINILIVSSVIALVCWLSKSNRYDFIKHVFFKFQRAVIAEENYSVAQRGDVSSTFPVTGSITLPIALPLCISDQCSAAGTNIPAAPQLTNATALSADTIDSFTDLHPAAPHLLNTFYGI